MHELENRGNSKVQKLPVLRCRRRRKWRRNIRKWCVCIIFKRTDKNVGLHQNALESVGPPAPAWKGRRGRSAFIFCILEVLALDNPRTTAYNKDKERRYPCKRLAPHQLSITKVMTATGWKRWAVISFCAFSFVFLCLTIRARLPIIKIRKGADRANG